MTSAGEAQTEKTYSGFWPLVMVASSIIVILGWNLVMALQQRSDAARVHVQQEVLAAQATQAEARLKAMMDDLLELSKTDPEAVAIVKKYGIKYNPPAQGAAAPVTKPTDTFEVSK